MSDIVLIGEVKDVREKSSMTTLDVVRQDSHVLLSASDLYDAVVVHLDLTGVERLIALLQEAARDTSQP